VQRRVAGALIVGIGSRPEQVGREIEVCLCSST
jgi:hypothetical protein